MKPPTPLTREVVNKLREKTELLVNNPNDRAVNYLAHEWLHLTDQIKILNDAIKDRDRQLAETREQIRVMKIVTPFKKRKR